MGEREASLSVLLVDDSAVMRKIIKSRLKQVGVLPENIDEASSGRKAIEKIESNGKYDMVLLDWSMPEMNGLECLEILRAHSKSDISSIPVIMVTAEGLKENVIKAAKAGANGYVVKPFESDRLLQEFDKVLVNNS